MKSPTINKKDSVKLGKFFNINYRVVPFKEWHYGLNVELEHGAKLSKLTNVTKNNHKITSKIAMAHLLEDPRYYYFLKRMEASRDKYWHKKGTKPSIFKKSSRRRATI